MRVSTFATLLSYSGCRRPTSWSSPHKIFIYNIYTLIVTTFSFAFVASTFGSMFTAKNVDEFVDVGYILVTVFVGCCKFTNMLLYRKEITNLMNVFLKEPCTTSNAAEAEIQVEYDAKVRRNAVRYITMVELTISITVFNSLSTNFQHGELTYKAWVPYNYTSTLVLSLTFIMQVVSVLFQSLIHIAADVLFFGMLIQICCQFEILLLRLNNVTRSNKVALGGHVRHHVCIYHLAGMLNHALYLTIFSQFFGSFLVLCLSLAQLLKADILSAEFLATTLYLVTMMLQSFLYCWYGNEVKLKSIDLSDVIFQTDWIGLTEVDKKVLLVIMERTRSPIELDSMHVITVNIDFFMILVKSSYSVYNLLQNTRK